MEYVVFRTGGKQYKVSKGSVIEVDRLSIKPEEKFYFEDVLLHVVDRASKVGKPKVTDVKVRAMVLEHTKGDKLRISKFKAKSKYRRVIGHRQYLTRIKIDEIVEKKKTSL